MNVDINGFGEELSKFVKSNHENDSLGTIKARLKDIFSKFGINDSNFSIISVAISADKLGVETKNCSSFINKYAETIFDKYQKDKQQREEDKKKQTQTPDKNVSFDASDFKNMSSEQISNTIESKLNLDEDELAKPCTSAEYKWFNLSSEEVNFPEGASIKEAIENFSKKAKLLFFQGNEKENSNQEDNQKSTTNQNGDELTEEDKQMIEDFGIEGIKTHSDMVEFMNSEEYEMIQQMQTNALSKNDDSNQE